MNSRLPSALPVSQRQLRAKNEILPADVEALRVLIKGGPKPKVEMTGNYHQGPLAKAAGLLKSGA
jgi:hypothetical protein